MGQKRCCICGKEMLGYGHNPAPIKSYGQCCDACDDLYVFPYRLAENTDNDALKQIVMSRVNALGSATD